MSAAHALLDVSPDVDPKELRAAYKRKAFELHPDRHGGAVEYVEKFKALQIAFEQLLEEAGRTVALAHAEWYEADRYQETRPRARQRETERQDFDPLDPDAGDRIWRAYVDTLSCDQMYDDDLGGGDVRGEGGW